MTTVLYDAPGPRTRRNSRLISAITAILILALLGYVIAGLAGQGLFGADRWDILNDPLVWLDLLRALGTTLSVAAIGAVGPSPSASWYPCCVWRRPGGSGSRPPWCSSSSAGSRCF